MIVLNKFMPRILIVLAGSCLAACSCLSNLKGIDPPVLELAHLSADDAPIVTIVAVYPDSLEVRQLGGQKKCRKLAIDSSRALQQAVKGMDLGDSETEWLGVHDEELWLTFEGRKLGYNARELPPDIETLLALIENLVLEVFARPLSSFY